MPKYVVYIWTRGHKKNLRKQLIINHLRKCTVELQGIEPWSKHIRRKLSTCLFSY